MTPALCGAPLPIAGEPCARRAGHTTDHRSRYAMNNAYRAKMGREFGTPRVRTICGAPMPRAKATCVRELGHPDDHRSRPRR